ncbi:MAG: hypothetical protein AAF937_00690 [Planctomycetota bacterium]
MSSDPSEYWATRIEKIARATLPDLDCVRRIAMDPRGRRTTRRLLASLVLSEPFEIDLGELAGDDDRLLAVAAGLTPCPAAPSPMGAIQDRSRDDVIELWTERELTLVHAAWMLHGWHAAAVASAKWLIHEIQPDNATNLPWAVHVFASLSFDESLDEAAMYAETLLHNCIVTTGKPDDLSALILLDSARQLRSRYTG